jgi:hypothetical protein
MRAPGVRIDKYLYDQCHLMMNVGQGAGSERRLTAGLAGACKQQPARV